MKKIAVVGTVGIPACYGGFESLVENLTLNCGAGFKYTVFCSSKSYVERRKVHNDAELVYVPINANGVSSIFYDVWSLIRCLKMKPDVVLILGVSGCLFLPFFKLLSKSKLVTNIDGLEWKRDKWGIIARKFLKLSEAIAVKYSDIVITDNQAIGDYVHNEYAFSSVTIAYGGDHAIRNIKHVNQACEPYALGLCRIEPENNVEMILDTYSKTSNKIKFVGNWASSEFGLYLREKYQGCENIELLDPVYDLDELYKLRVNCSLYLHGHSAGGTNPSLVEMMHFGIPIFAFDCSFNRHSTDNKAHYFKDEKQLKELIGGATNSELYHNSHNMMLIAKERYTWSEISRKYELTY